jgi:hypothetical protein
MRKFLRLSGSDKRILIRALCELLFVRIALSLGHAKIAERSQGSQPNSVSRDRIAWAVTVASRFIPKATCLTQAIAAKRLLERHGYDCALQLGVLRESAHGLRAHAWIESDGQIIIGQKSAGAFTPLR